MNVLTILIGVALLIFMVVAQWKMFEKAGQPGWAVIVPIYGTIVLLRIVNKPLWWLLLLLIPYVNIVFVVIVLNRLSKSFGKDTAFTVGMVLLPFIFVPILGFGDAQYDESVCK